MIPEKRVRRQLAQRVQLSPHLKKGGGKWVRILVYSHNFQKVDLFKTFYGKKRDATIAKPTIRQTTRMAVQNSPRTPKSAITLKPTNPRMLIKKKSLVKSLQEKRGSKQKRLTSGTVRRRNTLEVTVFPTLMETTLLFPKSTYL